MREWKACGYATLVGSMPHKDRDYVIDLILEKLPDIPVWPQLTSYRPEHMMIQYLEGLPGVRIIDGSPCIFTSEPSFEEELYAFYEDYLKVIEDPNMLANSRFALTQETGITFFTFIEKLRNYKGSYRAIKGQVVGPFTLLTGIKDEAGRAALYDERLQEIVAKHIALKAMWQIEYLREFGKPVIIFVDEPALAGFGSSAFISVTDKLIDQLLEEVFEGIHQKGGLAGIHVCANTDWNIVFRSTVDIINFDAYNYFDKFALYTDQFTSFIQRGGVVAWGIIPTSESPEALKETASTLMSLWHREIKVFVDGDITLPQIVEQSLFTPSCGCGALSESRAEQIVQLTRELSNLIRDKWVLPE